MAVLAVCALGALLFAQAVVRLRRRGRPDLAGWGRVAFFAAGIALVPISLLALDERADENLTWHMTQHVLVGDLSPALLVLATRGPLALFLLPPGVLKPLARTPLRRLVRPKIAYALWAANLAVWHVPALYDAALHHERLHYFEHACWAVAGLLAWTLLLDDRRAVGLRVALAAAMFASSQVLSDVLMFTFHPLYPAYPSLRQQQLAGVVMMAEQVLTLGTLAFVLLRPRIRPFRRTVTA
ncbi:MAG TPA: cytochrome c oxidase assembly protein [Gaiellaceae bacterium]